MAPAYLHSKDASRAWFWFAVELLHAVGLGVAATGFTLAATRGDWSMALANVSVAAWTVSSWLNLRRAERLRRFLEGTA